MDSPRGGLKRKADQMSDSEASADESLPDIVGAPPQHDADREVRVRLAKENKDLFEKLREKCFISKQDSTMFLKYMQKYDAQSHKDKVATAPSGEDLRVSYFHYNSNAFNAYLKKFKDWRYDELLRQKRVKVTETSTDEPHSFSHLPIQSLATASSSSSSAAKDDDVILHRFIPAPGPNKKADVIPEPPFLSAHRKNEALEAIGKPLAIFSLEQLRRLEGSYVELAACMNAGHAAVAAEIENRIRPSVVVFYGEGERHAALDGIQRIYPKAILRDGRKGVYSQIHFAVLREILTEYRRRGLAAYNLPKVDADQVEFASFLTKNPAEYGPDRFGVFCSTDLDCVALVCTTAGTMEDEKWASQFPVAFM